MAGYGSGGYGSGPYGGAGRSYSGAVLTDVPVGYWRLGEAAGTGIADSSGFGRTGAWSAAPARSASLLTSDTDKSVTLDGVITGQVPYDAGMNAPSALTLEAWVKTTASGSPNHYAILDRDASSRVWQFRMNSNGKLEFIAIGGSMGVVTATSVRTINDGAPHHVVATFDGASVRLYIDGTLDKTQAASGAFTTATTRLGIGVNNSGNGNVSVGQFVGQIDEAAYYTSVLSGSRIAAHYAAGIAAAGTPGSVTAPVATATATAPVPAVTGATAPPPSSPGTVLAPAATATAQALAPSVTGGAAAPTSSPGTVLVPVATATARALTPTVTGSGVVPAPGEALDLTPSEIGVIGPVGTWNLPPEIVVTILDPDVDEAPSSITVLVSMAPEGDLAFSIEGEDLWTATADETGIVGPLSLTVPEGLLAGTHELLVTGGGFTGSDQFRVANDPTALPSPEAPHADPVVVESGRGRWALQDLAEGGLGTWVMHPGPTSAASIPSNKVLQANQTTYALGKIHVTEGRSLAAEWTFAGYCPDRAFYDKLVAFGELNRRCYVIDHRGRAFMVAFLGPDLVPRKRQRADDGTFNDWAHDYTMRCLFYAEVEL